MQRSNIATVKLAAECCLALALSGSVPSAADAGPPYRTDDPEPTAFGHYQLYTFSTGTMVSNDTSGSAPAIEFDYGLVPNGQLTIGAPVAFDSPSGGSTQFGYGDTQLSFKYRFIQEDKDGFRPQVAVFPLVQFPTGDADRGLGVGHFVGFFPLWMQKSFGDWTTYGGGGYFLNRGGDDRDYWFVGGLLQRQLTEKLSVAGEIFHQTANKIGGGDSSGFNVGAIFDFDERNHFVFSVGRGFQNAGTTNEFSWYVGYEMTGP
jgi:hypothetical protein